MVITYLQNLFSYNKENKVLKKFSAILDKVNAFEEEMVGKSIDQLSHNTNKFKEQIRNGATLDEILPEAFATVREMSKRVLHMRHFDCQILGGIALHKGFISEMKTGEGKTLVATLPAYLNALTDKGVHIVTVNDYLAKRDSEWMGNLFSSLGLTVGCIHSEIKPAERKKQYDCSITYATNNELGFDYLKDNMVSATSQCLQRGFNYAIIDEVDSILIDEARTPLIISGPSEKNVSIYKKIDRIIKYIEPDFFSINERNRNVTLTESGMDRIEEILISNNILSKKESLYDFNNLSLTHHIDQALKAHHIFTRNKDYIVDKDQVIIIDDFTGRMMKGRRFSEGLHQALEAKENVTIQRENQTLASTTFQNYFRMYDNISGMTGTAKTEEKEFINIYGLHVITLPTNLTVRRMDYDDEIYCTNEEKLLAVVNLVKECQERNQPILIGTTSIKKSEIFSKMMKKNGIKHNVLNAKNHLQEALIIAKAGVPGAVTIATNMAGRGTDIKLGGVKEDGMSEKEYISKQNEVIASGGLYVVGTERHESRRVDNQLRGRSGRQGDPGQSKFFLCLEDDLLRLFGSHKVQKILTTLGIQKGDCIKHPMITRSIAKAQTKVEMHNYDIRKSLLSFDDVINSQRKVIFKHRKDILDIEEYDLLPIVEEVNNYIVSSSFTEANMENDDNISSKSTERKVSKSLLKLTSAIYNNSFFIEEESNLISDKALEFLNEKTISYINSKINDIDEAQRIKVVSKIFLLSLDELWRNHISFLDNLKMSIGMRSIGQQNPLVEFKKESFKALENLLFSWKENVLMRISRIDVLLHESIFNTINIMERKNDILDSISNNTKMIKRDKQSVTDDIRRNSLCSCGSGEKYKHCHGKI